MEIPPTLTPGLTLSQHRPVYNAGIISESNHLLGLCPWVTTLSNQSLLKIINAYQGYS